MKFIFLICIFAVTDFASAIERVDFDGAIRIKGSESEVLISGDGADYLWQQALEKGLKITSTSNEFSDDQTVTIDRWECLRTIKTKHIGSWFALNIGRRLDHLDGDTVCKYKLNF